MLTILKYILVFSILFQISCKTSLPVRPSEHYNENTFYPKASILNIPIRIHKTELQEASNVAERMRSHIEALAIDGVKESVTASFGISQYQKGDHSYSDIVERADQALYEAKEQGRNQVVMFQVH